LQVVAFTRDVGDDLDTVHEANLGDLPQRRVRLLRGRGVHASAHAALLGVRPEVRRLPLVERLGAAVTEELIDRGHRIPGRAFKRLAGMGKQPPFRRQTPMILPDARGVKGRTENGEERTENRGYLPYDCPKRKRRGSRG